ncbi:MAG: hypothetical protein AB7V36_09245 [Bacteroidales bacterium]
MKDLKHFENCVIKSQELVFGGYVVATTWTSSDGNSGTDAKTITPTVNASTGEKDQTVVFTFTDKLI